VGNRRFWQLSSFSYETKTTRDLHRRHRGLAQRGVTGDFALDAVAFAAQEVAHAAQLADHIVDLPQRCAGDALDRHIVADAYRFLPTLGEVDLHLFAEGNYYGKQYFDAFNTERIAQGAYGVANARVSFQSTAARGFEVGAWVKNLTNRQYLAYGLNQKDLDTGVLGFDYGLVGEPRTYGVDATLRF